MNTTYLTGDLKAVRIMSGAVGLLMIIVTVAGLLYPSTIYPTRNLLSTFHLNDFANLVFGLPLLHFSMILAGRGRLTGLLCWVSALVYVLYTYIPFMIAMPFGILFLPYTLLVVLSAYALIDLVAKIDGEAVRRSFTERAPSKSSAVLLLAFALMIPLREALLIVQALLSHSSVDLITAAVWIDDVVVASPLLLIAGVRLWSRKEMGFVLGPGMLLAYGVLSLGLILMLLLQPRYTGNPVSVGDVVVLAVMALVCLIPFALLLANTTKPGGDEQPES